MEEGELNNPQKRKSRRYPLQQTVECVIEQRVCDATLSNISEGGLQLKGLDPGEFDVGRRVSLRVTVPSSRGAFETDGLVVWRSDDAAGISFEFPTEQLSFALRRFLKKYLLLASTNDLSRYIDGLFEAEACMTP